MSIGDTHHRKIVIQSKTKKIINLFCFINLTIIGQYVMRNLQQIFQSLGVITSHNILGLFTMVDHQT